MKEWLQYLSPRLEIGDYVVKFDEETPMERIKEIKPDYIFKG